MADLAIYRLSGDLVTQRPQFLSADELRGFLEDQCVTCPDGSVPVLLFQSPEAETETGKEIGRLATLSLRTLDNCEFLSGKILLNGVYEYVRRLHPSTGMFKEEVLSDPTSKLPGPHQMSEEDWGKFQAVVGGPLVRQDEFGGWEWRDNKPAAIAQVRQNGFYLDSCPAKFKKDRDVVAAALENNVGSLQFVSEELRGTREIALAAVNRNGYAMQFLPEEFKDDFELAMLAVRKWGQALQHCSEKMRGDREIALAAVADDGYALMFCSDELRKDRDVVTVASSSQSSRLEVLKYCLDDNLAAELSNIDG